MNKLIPLLKIFATAASFILDLGEKNGLSKRTTGILLAIALAGVVGYFLIGEAKANEIRAWQIVDHATTKAEKRLNIEAPSWWRQEAWTLLQHACKTSPKTAIQNGYERLSARFPTIPVHSMRSIVSALGYSDAFLESRLKVACRDVSGGVSPDPTPIPYNPGPPPKIVSCGPSDPGNRTCTMNGSIVVSPSSHNPYSTLRSYYSSCQLRHQDWNRSNCESSGTVRQGQIFAERLPLGLNMSFTSRHNVSVSLAERGETNGIAWQMAISRKPGDFAVGPRCRRKAITADFKLLRKDHKLHPRMAAGTERISCVVEAGKVYYLNVRPAPGQGCGTTAICRFQTVNDLANGGYLDPMLFR